MSHSPRIFSGPAEAPEPVARRVPIAWGWWLLAAICLGGALVAPGLCLYRLARHDDWITGSRYLRAVGPAGEIPRTDEVLCGGIGARESVVWDGAIWTPCDDLGIVRMDPARGEATALWPLPAESRLRGFMPGPGRRMAWVVEAGHEFLVGIANANGWEQAPQSVGPSRPGLSSLIGLAWVASNLEVVHFEFPLAVQISRMVPGAAPVHRTLRGGPDGLYCQERLHDCTPIGAYRESGAWRVLLADRLDGPAQVFSLAEDGSMQPREGSPSSAQLRNIDRSALGVASGRNDVWGDDVIRIDAAGRLSPAAPLDYWASAVYQVDGDRIRFLPLASRHGIGRSDAAPGLEIGSDGSVADTTRGTAAKRVTGSLPVNELAILPRHAGGVWLVAPESGAYVAVEDGRRADPLGVVEHLRRRRPWGAADDRDGEKQLAFLLFGLPVMSGIAAGCALMLSRRGRRPRRKVMLASLTLAFVLFGIVSIPLAMSLVPILR